MVRLTIQWTETARRSLAKLPLKVRRGLLDKANELLHATDPEHAHKPLVGPLQGYYRISYARYRAIYSVVREKTTGGDVLEKIIIRFVAAGVRKEGDKSDVYRLAQKLVRLMDEKAESKSAPREDAAKKEKRHM